MYCNDCGDTLRMDLKDYIKTKERTGVVLCTDCRNGPRREEAPKLTV
ncbi:MAG: hypothetical protein ABEK12_01610 [Candidatus Nanohaloarchaea archaeon]